MPEIETEISRVSEDFILLNYRYSFRTTVQSRMSFKIG